MCALEIFSGEAPFPLPFSIFFYHLPSIISSGSYSRLSPSFMSDFSDAHLGDAHLSKYDPELEQVHALNPAEYNR